MKRKREDEVAKEDVGVEADLLSPQGPTVIGPTPQRDGIVLGLFDLPPAGTPSKKRAILADVELNVLQTPSRKLQGAASETSLESRARGERTPLSTGKRFLFNQFVTPKKRKLEEEGTPTSTLRGLATPAFLRRHNVMSAIEETDENTPRPAPWKRRGLGRSLSAMIQAMRKEEDDELDEQADIMREMEMEEEGIPVPKRAKQPGIVMAKQPDIIIEDSQAPMPLGPDRGLESEEDTEGEPELGQDGKPRRVWKKKGLKRQTRRVISKSCILSLAATANHIQCGPTLPNLNPNRVCRSKTTQETKKLAFQSLKPPPTSTGQLIRRMTMNRTTRARPHILASRAEGDQRRQRKLKRRRKRMEW